MANRRALWINGGSVTQLATTDGLLAAELDVTSGNLTLGGTNASAILLGANIDKDSAEALVIGGTNATAVQFGTDIDKDAAEALVIGGTNATVVQFGVGIDADAAQALVVGAANATSVQFGTGIDKDAAEALVIGGTNATSVQFGANIDKDAAEQFDIGVTNATAVRVQDILIDATVIDTNGAAVLSIGTANATAITIGDVGVITTVAGDLNVTGDEQVTGSTTFLGDTTIGDASTDTLTITASVDSDINFVGPQQLTTSSGDMKLIPEGTTIAQGGLGVALTFTNYTTSASTLTGTGTAFDTELQVGDAIEVDLDGGTTVDIRRVTAIASATSLTVNAAFTSDVGPVAHGLNKDDNLFEVYNGYGDSRVTVDKNGVTTFTRGAIDLPVLTLTNDEDSASAGVFVSAGTPTATAGDGSMTLDVTNGDIYVRKSAVWELLTTSSGSSLQTAYNAGQTITMTAAKGDMVITVDEVSTYADFQVTGTSGDYLLADASAAEAKVGSATVAATMFSPVANIGTNDAGANYMMQVVAPTSSITVNANTTTFATSATAKTITGNGNNTLTVAGTTGGLNLTTTTAPMNIQTTTGLLTITTTTGDIDIAPSGTGTVFVQNASNEGLQIDDTGEITILGGGATVSISDGSGAGGITLTGATGDIQISNAGVSNQEIGIQAGGDVNIDAGLNSPTNGGDITLDAAKGSGGGGIISLDAHAASNFTVDAGTLTLSTTTSGNVEITTASTADVVITTSGAGGTVDVNSGAGGVTVDAIAGTIALTTTTSGDITADAAGLISLDADGSSNFTVATGTLTLETTTSGQLNVTAADNLVMSGDAVTIDANNTNGFSIDGTAASNVTVTAGNLSLLTAGGSGNVILDAAATGGTASVNSTAGTTISADAGGVTIDATAGHIAITAPAASDVNITATSDAASDINFAAHGLTIPFNATTSTTLNTTAQDIIGALNELQANSGEYTLTRVAGTGGVVAGNIVYIDSADTNRVRKADSDAAASSRIIGFARTTQAITEAVEVDTLGEVTVSSDLSGDAQGAYVYLTGTAGEVSTTAPASGTILRVGIITDVGTGAGDGKILIQVGTPVTL